MDIAVSIILFVSLIIFITRLIYLIQGPPFVPSDDDITETIVDLAKKYHAKKALDLGAGKGKLVIALAHAGIFTQGIEIDPFLVRSANHNIRKAKLQTKASVRIGDFWYSKISEYDTIVVYGIKHIMRRLGHKLQTELKPGVIVITNFYQFPQWKPIESHSKVHVYRIKKTEVQ